ncbi:MAG: substrate-binding domain-containing protein [Planctomycetota bacterium]
MSCSFLRRVIARLALLTCLGAALPAGCNGKAVPPSGADTRAALADIRDPRTRALSYSLREAATTRNVDLDVEFFDDSKQQRQRVRSWLATGAAAIIVQPVDSDGSWKELLDEARALGVVVVTVDRRLQSVPLDAVAGHVGADPEEQGANAAIAVRQVLAELDRDPDLTGREAPANEGSENAPPPHRRVLTFPGPDDATTRARTRSFASGLSTPHAVDSLDAIDPESFRASPTEVIDSLRDAGTPGSLAVDVVFIHRASDAARWLQSLRKAKLRPGRAVRIVCIGADVNTLLDVRTGAIAACIDDDPLLGPVVLDHVSRLRQKLPTAPVVRVPSPIITQDSASRLLPSRRY